MLYKTDCPPKLLHRIQSFHEDMKGTIQYNVSSPEAFKFDIHRGVKLGSVLVPTLFWIHFSLLLKHAVMIKFINDIMTPPLPCVILSQAYMKYDHVV